MNTLLCKVTNNILKIKDITVDFKVQRTIRSHITRSGLDLKEILRTKGIDTTRCNFCGNEVPFRLLYEIVDNTIDVVGIVPGYSHLCKAPHYCSDKNCPGKSLNRNSIEFVSKAYGISEDDAHTYILERNKTPFYRNNHRSDEEYTNYQTSQSHKVTKEGLTIGAYKRSLEGYIDKYGLEKGQENYKNLLENKKHTKELYIDRYGEEVGLFKWIQAKNLRSVTKINTIEELYSITLSVLQKADKSDLQTIPPHVIVYRTLGFPILKRYPDFDTSIDEVVKNLIKIHPNLDVFDPTIFKKTGKGYYSWTDKQSLLRSKHERQVYNLLVEAKLEEEVDFFVDVRYPDSNLRCDFYFPMINKYIEIAGLMKDIDYSTKMNKKQQKFGSVIIEPSEIIEKITDIINEIKSTSI